MIIHTRLLNVFSINTAEVHLKKLTSIPLLLETYTVVKSCVPKLEKKEHKII